MCPCHRCTTLRLIQQSLREELSATTPNEQLIEQLHEDIAYLHCEICGLVFLLMETYGMGETQATTIRNTIVNTVQLTSLTDALRYVY